MSNQNNKQRRSLPDVSEADVYEFAPLDRETIARYAAAEERFLAANPDITQHEVRETNMMDAVAKENANRPCVVDSRSVFDWPEWKALADRLGIDNSYIRRLSITLENGKPVTVSVERLAAEHK